MTLDTTLDALASITPRIDVNKDIARQSMPPSSLPVSVITTCYGRNRHLYNLLASLEVGSYRPDEVIIVNDDADQQILESFELNIVQIATNMVADISTDTPFENATHLSDDKDHAASLSPRFDIGINRNRGAQAASYSSLIFLDVDCIASYHFIEGIYDTLQSHPLALLMGQPRYLTRPLSASEARKLRQESQSQPWLDDLSVLNPYRHNLIDDNQYHTDKTNASCSIEATDDYGAFWSLCFAIDANQFGRIGGFDNTYIGYGAEDTDFAFSARQNGVDFYLTADVVYHQQHPVYRPPLNHLADIVINANRFYQKWQHWAMGAWLQAFVDMGLIVWQSQQVQPIEVLRHPTEAELNNAYCADAAFV